MSFNQRHNGMNVIERNEERLQLEDIVELLEWKVEWKSQSWMKIAKLKENEVPVRFNNIFGCVDCTIQTISFLIYNYRSFISIIIT
jgi:hypothetical protein